MAAREIKLPPQNKSATINYRHVSHLNPVWWDSKSKTWVAFNFSVRTVYNFIEMLDIYGLHICLIYVAPMPVFLLYFSQRELVW